MSTSSSPYPDPKRKNPSGFSSSLYVVQSFSSLPGALKVSADAQKDESAKDDDFCRYACMSLLSLRSSVLRLQEITFTSPKPLLVPPPILNDLLYNSDKI